MKAAFLVLLTGLIACPTASAIPYWQFTDIDTYLERSDYILVVKCVSVPDNPEGFVDGLYPADIEVLKSLKGDKTPGAEKLATTHSMQPGQRYLVASTPGSAFETTLLSIGELSVVPVPKNFNLASLEGKPCKQQVQILLARHLYEIERKLAPLLEAQRALNSAVADRDDNVYQSQGNVTIGDVRELETTKRNSMISLNLGGVPLPWSHSAPGKSGYFYFSDHLPATPDWEFAAIDADELDELDGAPLRATFFGLYCPSRDPKLGQPHGNAISVNVGQVLLARTVTQPKTIYILKLHQQGQSETLKVRYAVWKE